LIHHFQQERRGNAMNITAPPDTVSAMAQLADTLGHASTGLFNYRCDNPRAPDAAQALQLEMELDQRAIDLRKNAIVLLGNQSAQAVARLSSAAARVTAFLAQVTRIEARLTLASAVIALATAALARDAGGVLNAAADVETALKTVSA
jgi:hypothetical protein